MLVRDEWDLEDVVRALLPLHFDEVRPCARTPKYAAFTRTDFLLAPQRIAVNIKYVRPPLTESQLAEELRTDVAYWRGQGNCNLLMCLIYDPEGMLRDHAALEAAWSAAEAGWEVRCVIA
jgi:hypothetical protein